MGIAVVASMLIQVVAGMLRPGLTSPKRPYFNWAHRLNGFGLHILAGEKRILSKDGEMAED